jgi:hypothetical protein
MKKQSLLFFFMTGMVFAGCTSTYKFDNEKYADYPMEKGKSYYIATSEDGFYNTEVYTGSGRTVSSIIKQQLQKYAAKTTVFRDRKTIDDFTDAELSSVDYVVIPEILHWEDRATFWSGLPDKVDIQISIYDSHKTKLNSTVISGKSATTTLDTTDPSELVEKPVETYLSTLF